MRIALTVYQLILDVCVTSIRELTAQVGHPSSGRVLYAEITTEKGAAATTTTTKFAREAKLRHNDAPLKLLFAYAHVKLTATVYVLTVIQSTIKESPGPYLKDY